MRAARRTLPTADVRLTFSLRISPAEFAALHGGLRGETQATALDPITAVTASAFCQPSLPWPAPQETPPFSKQHDPFSHQLVLR